MVNNVSIATRPLVYSAFRYINNKVWTALAEYIDNSLQSFLNHRDELEKSIMMVNSMCLSIWILMMIQ